jgi:toxin ParE1/3/4
MASQPKRFEVLLTRGAEQDLEALHDYVAEFDSPIKAGALLDKLMEVVRSLAHSPERGSYPKELAALGVKTFRQTAFKPYRVIYLVTEGRVLIYLIVDGRRNLQALLERRLLGAAGS